MKRRWIGWALLALALAGCGPVAGYAQPAVQETSAVALTAGETWGQTFTARQAGLTGLSIFVQSHADGVGALRVHLRASPQDTLDLAVAEAPLASLTAPGFYAFTFAPQTAPPPADYYFELELMGDSAVILGGAPGASYLDGARYHNGAPDEGQLAFTLQYAAPAAYLGLANQMGQWALWALAALWLFVVPGWALLTLIGPRFDSLSFAEKFTLAGGIGLALYPVLLVWADVIHWRAGALWAWLPGLLGGGALILRQRGRKPGRPRLPLAEAMVFVLSLIILGIRLWIVRAMDAPAWGDSVQHVIIAQRLIESGGLFSSWQPYAPYTSLTVQFGFSAAVAVFHWLTGIDSLTATLIVGQVLNALAVIGLYPLAVRLARGNPWAGVSAMLIAGLLMPIPAVYANWGRYAQLAGQVIVLPALWLTWEALEHKHARALIAVGVVLTGLMLTYYRMPFYYAAFLAPWLVGQYRINWRGWLDAVARLVGAGALAGALIIPWALRLQNSNLSSAVEGGVARGSTLELVRAEFLIWQQWAAFAPPLLMGLALAGVAWAAFRKNWAMVAIGVGAALVGALPAGRLIHLPFANLLQSYAVIIALYIPVGLAGGWLAGEIMAFAVRGRAGQWALGGAVTLFALWAAWTQQQIIRPEYAMLTRPDLRAIEWIEQNTAPDARFLVEGFRIYNGLSAVGADGGWYIPLLTERANTMPPQYAMFNEQPDPPDYTQRVVDLVAALEAESLNTRALCEWGVTHVYVGQGQGLVGAGVRQLFAPEALLQNSAFTRVYAQDRVSIFAFDSTICNALP